MDDVESEVGQAETDLRPKKLVKYKPLSKKRIEKFNEAQAKKGIVYLSRIPPFMKPAKIRHLLGDFGDVQRIYLQEEDSAIRKKRIRHGGNKKVNYTEGWVEFSDKKDAKRAATILNTTPMGGKKKSGFYHDDLWNIKYLSKFKWDNLTEKIAYENRVREQRLKAESLQAKRERQFYLQKVAESKKIAAIEERKKRKAAKAAQGDGGGEGGGGVSVAETEREGKGAGAPVGDDIRIIRRFHQRKAIDSGVTDASAAAIASGAASHLSASTGKKRPRGDSEANGNGTSNGGTAPEGREAGVSMSFLSRILPKKRQRVTEAPGDTTA